MFWSFRSWRRETLNCIRMVLSVGPHCGKCRRVQDEGWRKVDVRVDKPEQDYMVELDAQYVKRILSNFLSNALKNTQSGHIDIAYSMADGGVKISVKDTGCGIPQDKLPLVFDRFEKVDSFVQGVGLGCPFASL